MTETSQTQQLVFAMTWVTVFVLGLSAPTTLTAQQIVWQDEFNGESLNRNWWVHDVGGHGFGNAQLEFNTARRENAYVKDGKLLIVARKENYRGRQFTSARINTQGRFAFQYGSLEARIKVPDTANGVWPAFWLLGNNFPAINWPKCGEADILEIGSKEGIAMGTQHRRINCALHFADQSESKKSLVNWYTAKTDLHRDFHRYRVEWTPKEMRFFLDDQEYGQWDLTKPEFREFHQPFFPIFNVAVGSFKHTYTGIDSPEQVTAKFPAKMEIDWIRLTANAHTKVVLGGDGKAKGKFMVYGETTTRKLAYADDTDPEFPYKQAAVLRTWNNIKVSEVFGSAAEGRRHWSFNVSAGDWFGAGVFLPNHRNMANYSDGFLHFQIKSETDTLMRVGIKSSRGSEFWLPLGNEEAEFGFRRDGQWQAVKIPLNRFANVDFPTVHQMFMIAGDRPPSDFQMEIDNIWWEPGAPRPAPSGGAFGIFTDNPDHRKAGEFKLGQAGNFFIWENTLKRTAQTPFEGTQSIALRGAGSWAGAAFTPNVKYDLRAYDHPEAKLRFAIKTASRRTFQIGMKSGNLNSVGQKWITFESPNDPYGLKRNGQWQTLEIPTSVFSSEVDFSQVSQLFQIMSSAGAIEEVELDDICLIPAASNRSN